MENVLKILVGLAAVAFLMAVIGSAFTSGPILGTRPEAFSRASSNLALIVIALALLSKGRSTAAQS